MASTAAAPSDTQRLSGVNPILPTPFTEEGGLDLPSLERLIDLMADVGADGVAILGFLGEAHKLSGAERAQVVRTVVARAAGRLSVWVGVRALGTAGCVEQAREAQESGADAVFVAPIAPQNDEALYRHFRTVAEAVEIPLILHDYPASFGLKLSVPLIGRLAREGFAPYIKLEDTPALPKLTAVLEASEGRIGVFGGLGGQFFLEELERGAAGIMTGFAFPEVLIDIHRRFRAGDRDGAAEVFHRTIDLMRYEFQPGIGLAFRKHVYHRRGVFASEACRPPAAAMTDVDRAEFARVAARCGLALGPDEADDRGHAGTRGGNEQEATS